MIKGIAHICLIANDMAAAERFYCNGLGFKKAFDFIRAGKPAGFYLEVTPGAYIEIFPRDDIDPKAKSPIQHFCLEVDALEPLRKRLMDLGYEVTEKKLGADHSWQMWTSDPSGTRIEFHHYTPDSCQLTRQNCVLG